VKGFAKKALAGLKEFGLLAVDRAWHIKNLAGEHPYKLDLVQMAKERKEGEAGDPKEPTWVNLKEGGSSPSKRGPMRKGIEYEVQKKPTTNED